MSGKAINIVEAISAGDYRLELTFDDGVKRIVDFKPFLSHARHPDIRAYLDLSRFLAFRVEYGELVWGDYELCFPVIDLYRNTLAPTDKWEAAA
jgi:hypothetical protein